MRLWALHLCLGVLCCGLLSSNSASAQPYGLGSRTVVSGVNFPLAAPTSSSALNIELVRAFPSLTFAAPVLMISARDGTKRNFVVERSGTIRVFPNVDTATTTTVFLNITPLVSIDGEQGLLGLAFDPNFKTNGYFYVYYNPSTGARRSRISRFKVSADPNVADPASEFVVIEITQPVSTSNHKGGMIAFGADNMLYIGLGDGGGGGDTSNNAQNCANMLGSMLRIDPNGASPYAIPSDNPYAGSANYNCGIVLNAPSRACGKDGYVSGQICKEIWASGLRNPWRWSFDRVTHELWAGDVGQGTWEEVDIVRRGNNLGWRVFEGTHNYNNPSNLPLSNYTSPILDYDRTEGNSVTGGFVYRGTALPEIYGRYVFGDYGSGRVWILEYDGANVISKNLIGGIGGMASFGEDEDGEIYAISITNGYMRRFRRKTGTNPGGVVPAKLSETGLFSNLSTLTPTPGMIEFDVNAPLWSDNAIKRRWLALPGTSTITFSPTEAYTYPVGTALVKHFSLRLSASEERRLETRVLFRHNEGWAGYTYKWNDEQTDAFLLSGALSQTFTINEGATSRTQTWTYPSRENCLGCHTDAAGVVLGPRTRQLNKTFNYAGVVDNQLRSWNHIGLFSTDIGAATAYEAHPTGYGEAAGTLEKRTRAYLESNCAHCHRPGVPRSDAIDLRSDTALNSMMLVGVAPTFGDLGIPSALRVRAGAKEQSVLWERIRRLDENRMPLLGSSLVDPVAVDIVGRWIDQVVSGNYPPAAPKNLRSP